MRRRGKTRVYRVTFIIRLDIGDAAMEKIRVKYKHVLEELGAKVLDEDDMGKRKLAYTIKKQIHGYYMNYVFAGDGAMVKELERRMRIDDAVLRFMTVLVDPRLRPEKPWYKMLEA